MAPGWTWSGASWLLIEYWVSVGGAYEDGGDGWIVASIPEVHGAHSQGRTRAEARANVIDALQTMLTPDQALELGPETRYA